jgi:hypothetical protein
MAALGRPFNSHRFEPSGYLSLIKVLRLADPLTGKCIVAKRRAEDHFDETETRNVSTLEEFNHGPVMMSSE